MTTNAELDGTSSQSVEFSRLFQTMGETKDQMTEQFRTMKRELATERDAAKKAIGKEATRGQGSNLQEKGK